MVLHQGAIGDFLLTLSVVQAARDLLGVKEVVSISTAASARVAAGRGAVDVWQSPDAAGLYRLFRSEPATDVPLAGITAQAEFVLSFLGSPRERVHEQLSALAGGKVVSIDPRPSAVTRRRRRHITDQWATDIRAAGWSIGDPAPARIHLGSGAAAGRRPRPVRVLIHPGSGGKAKCWPLERFFELADALRDLDVTWMLGPAEFELARRVQDRDEPLLVEEDLESAAEQMAGFDLYVGNDSGMTHLAAAIGLPTVAIFVATDPRIWRPLGEHVVVVEADGLGFEGVLTEVRRRVMD